MRWEALRMRESRQKILFRVELERSFKKRISTLSYQGGQYENTYRPKKGGPPKKIEFWTVLPLDVKSARYPGPRR